MTHRALSELARGQQAWGTKGDVIMAKKEPEKVIKDLQDYGGDRGVS
jgi:hypothetical protein